MPVLLSSWAEWNFYFLCLVVVAVGAVAAMGGRVRGQAFCVLLFTGSTAAILYCLMRCIDPASKLHMVPCFLWSTGRIQYYCAAVQYDKSNSELQFTVLYSVTTVPCPGPAAS